MTEMMQKKHNEMLERLKFVPNINNNNMNITPFHVQSAFKVIDEIFLDSYFEKNYKNRFCFDVSNRMTSSGANISTSNLCNFKIKVSNILIRHAYITPESKRIVNGILCENRVHALCNLIQHEMVHAIEYIKYHKSGHNKRFLNLANVLFGHTEMYHQLHFEPGQNEEFKIGDKVMFYFRNKKEEGQIIRITKRATVKTNKNSKWYVPLTNLKKID
jgi:hypothetical protein